VVIFSRVGVAIPSRARATGAEFGIANRSTGVSGPLVIPPSRVPNDSWATPAHNRQQRATRVKSIRFINHTFYHARRIRAGRSRYASSGNLGQSLKLSRGWSKREKNGRFTFT